MKMLVLATLLFASRAFGAEIDVAEFIDQVPTPLCVPTLYSDLELQKAAREFSDLPRPWTVPKLIEVFERETASLERMVRDEPKWWVGPKLDHYFRLRDRCESVARLLGASRDPRAGLVLGKAIETKNLHIEKGAIMAICDFFFRDPRYLKHPLDPLPIAGRFRDEARRAEQWWKLNKSELGAEAAKMAK